MADVSYGDPSQALDILNQDNDPLAPGGDRATVERQQRLVKDTEESMGKAGQAIESAQQNAGKEIQIRERSDKALEPQRRALVESGNQLTAAAGNVPTLQKPPPAPKRNDADADQQWLMIAGILGSIAGGLTRNHVSNALAAFGGALEGFNEGSKQKFDQNMKIWDAENKNIKETNDASLARYKEILESNKLNVEQKRTELEIEAKRWDDKAMAAAARTKNDLAIAQAYDYKARLSGQLYEQTEKLQQQTIQFQQKQQTELMKAQMRAVGINTNDPSAMQAYITAIGEYRMAAPPGARGAAIRAEVARQFPNYREEEFVKRRRAALSAGGSWTPLMTQQVSNMVAAIDHLETLRQLGKALDGGDITLINRLKQKIADETGSPVPPTFDAAKRIIAAEVVRAITGASGGGVTDRREIGETMDRAKSPQQINAVADIYQRLLAAQMKARGRVYEYAQGQKLEDSILLSPKAKEIYKTLDDNVIITHDDLQGMINSAFSGAQSIAGAGARAVAGTAADLTTEGARNIPRIGQMPPGWKVEPLPGDMPIPVPP